jgi:hypothetical protein
LAGSNIYITEDFSKRVKDRRSELQKFMKKLKKRSVKNPEIIYKKLIETITNHNGEEMFSK